MEKNVVLTNLTFANVNGNVIFSSVLDSEHFCIVVRVEPLLYKVITRMNDKYFDESFDDECYALRFAAVEVVKYIL